MISEWQISFILKSTAQLGWGINIVPHYLVRRITFGLKNHHIGSRISLISLLEPTKVYARTFWIHLQFTSPWEQGTRILWRTISGSWQERGRSSDDSSQELWNKEKMKREARTYRWDTHLFRLLMQPRLLVPPAYLIKRVTGTLILKPLGVGTRSQWTCDTVKAKNSWYISQLS